MPSCRPTASAPGSPGASCPRWPCGPGCPRPSWRSSPSWCSPTSTSSPRPASPVTPTSSPRPSAARSAVSNGWPWTCVRGASEEVSTRRAERADWALPKTLTVLLVPDDRAAPRPRPGGSAHPGPGRGPARTWRLGEDYVALLVPDLRATRPASAAAVPARLRRRARADQTVAADRFLLPARPAGRAPAGRREPNERSGIRHGRAPGRAGARAPTPTPWPTCGRAPSSRWTT